MMLMTLTLSLRSNSSIYASVDRTRAQVPHVFSVGGRERVRGRALQTGNVTGVRVRSGCVPTTSRQLVPPT